MNHILSFVLLAACPMAGEPQPLQAPQLFVPTPLITPTPRVDMGEIRSGPALVRKIEIKNTTAGSVIKITNISTGCNCLRVEVQPKQLQPGMSASVTLTLNTLTPPEGPVEWKSTLSYTVAGEGAAEMGAGTLDVKLFGNLVREVAVTPPAVAASVTGEISQTLTVTDRRGMPLSVRAATSTQKHITTAVQPATTSKGVQSQPVVVTVSADLPAGTHDETITLITDDPAVPELKVPVKIVKRAAGGVTVSPEVMNVRLARGQENTSVAAQLRAGGRPVKIAKVECGLPGVTVRWSEGTDPVATLRAVVNTAAGTSGQGELRVILSEPSTTITLPITWYTP